MSHSAVKKDVNKMAATGEKDVENPDKAAEIGCVLQSFAEEAEINSMLDNLAASCANDNQVELIRQSFVHIFGRYQEQPHLLDAYLDGWLGRLLTTARSTTDSVLRYECFRVVYVITKVRGFKVILRHLPHEVADLEPVLNLLAEQDPHDKLTWETRYILLLWLSIIVMIPFHMTRLDGNVDSEHGGRKPIIERIIESGKLYLAFGDKPLDAAAYLLARFITRPDVKESYLQPFVDWATEGVSMYGPQSPSRVGELATLALIFKHGKREDLLPHAARVLKCLLAKDFKSSKNASLRKLSIKLTQRIGMTFLKPRLASWRYQRGSRSLEANLGASGAAVVTPSVETVSENGRLEDEDEDDFDVPEEVENVLQELLNVLKDKENVIRWSAAKGIGRVTGRLPKYLADEVVGSVLECFKAYETDCSWHGGCLAIAELGRRGLLLPERLPEVVPVILQALLYDEQKGSYSVGDHIRDAACYVSWAFARAYEPQEMQPYVTLLANALVIATVFDREVHCRRAASAAFQENVGRQGTFPHGIDILTAANFFTVGNRNKAFLELSVTVCQYPEYVRPMVEHLVTVKIHHWDASLRELAAAALRHLARMDVDHVIGDVMPRLMAAATSAQLISRHGCVLAMAEIVHGLTEAGFGDAVISNEKIVEGVRDIVPILQEKKLFRGSSGELMRVAACVLIKKASISKLPFHGQPIIEIWQTLLDDCLRHAEVKVQSAAVLALSALYQEYLRGDTQDEQQHRDQLVNRFVKELRTSSETCRIGYTMALGALPGFMLRGKLDLVISSLIDCAKIGTEAETVWAKSRKDAINSLCNICTTMGINPDGNPSDVVCSSYLVSIIECFLGGLRDYTTDSCGDIGSHVRLAAMSGLENVLRLMSADYSNYITEDFSRRIMCNVAQLAVERIENVRNVAGSIFYNFLHRIKVAHIPHHDELREIFAESECADIYWNRPCETFFRFAQMLALPAYTYHVLLGFCNTAGGLSEHLVRDSVAALQRHLESPAARKRCEQDRLCDAALRLFDDHRSVNRVTIPLMKTLDRLLSTGIFDAVLLDPDSTFASALLERVRREVGTSRDLSKVLVGVTLICELLQCPRAVSQRVLSQLGVFLCHSYPVVRKEVAGKMFTAFVSYDHLVPEEAFDETVNLLSETDWCDAVATVKPIRNRLCELLGVPQPKLVAARRAPEVTGGGEGVPLSGVV